MTHTHGPWTTDEMGFIYAPADAELPLNSNQGACLVVAKTLNRGAVRSAANARLIAAAPDLLVALEACMTDDGANCLAYGTDTPMLRRRLAAINAIAREAIRKAKG